MQRDLTADGIAQCSCRILREHSRDCIAKRRRLSGSVDRRWQWGISSQTGFVHYLVRGWWLYVRHWRWSTRVGGWRLAAAIGPWGLTDAWLRAARAGLRGSPIFTVMASRICTSITPLPLVHPNSGGVAVLDLTIPDGSFL